MNFVKSLDDIEIAYRDEGQGLPLVFISGFMGIGDIWRDQVARFKAIYRCITHDSRGYGHSEAPEDAEFYSVENHALDTKAILDSIGISGPVVLITHSMGGNIATEFALRFPDMVAGIVYTGTYASGPQLVGLGLSEAALIGNPKTPSAAAAFYSSMGLRADIASEAAKWSKHGVRGNARALATYDPSPQYGQITAPVLIIQGDRDIATPLTPCADDLKKAIGRARLEARRSKSFPAYRSARVGQ